MTKNGQALILHITDVHLRAKAGQRLLGVDTLDSFRAVLRQATLERQPDAVLATGDIAHDPEPQTYQRFTDVLREYHAGPLLVLPGNHDLTAPMTALFDAPADMDLGAWTVVGFDSHQDNEVAALVTSDELDDVRARCRAAAARYVLLATHHPPVALGMPWLDQHRIDNATALLDWASEQGNVKGLVFGHAHQDIDRAHGELRLLGTPSTCFQFAPRSDRFAIDDKKPGYRWLYLASDGTLTHELRRVDDYPLTIDLEQP